ncbi:nucleoside 2-deoxyribosyltransferase [Aerococcaceae bacterium DSM 111020]|nr:nucleoside 2-deoxyribosyltransferase [Aerococcaceae bacterium DSM 111020]
MQIYFAAPLFSEAELLYNEHVVEKIRQSFPNIDVFLPQEQADINDKQSYADSKMIAQLDTDALLDSNMLVAVLDGLSIDPGVASEIGIAYQAGIPIIGLYTDSRQQGATNQQKLDALQELAESQFSYINLYTVGLIKLNGTVVDSINQLIENIETYQK